MTDQPHKPFGLSMEGCEAPILQEIEHAIFDSEDEETKFVYLEIGIAGGKTFAAITDFLSQRFVFGEFESVGLDIPNGWSLSMRDFNENTKGQEDFINLILEDSHSFLKHTVMGFNFVLIDGCHERKCVKEDFYLVAPKVKPGGVVCFHDTSQGCQGIHPQPHNGEPIGVRKALEEIGLFKNEYPGFRFLFEYSENHGCAFFQKEK